MPNKFINVFFILFAFDMDNKKVEYKRSDIGYWYFRKELAYVMCTWEYFIKPIKYYFNGEMKKDSY